MKHLLTLKDLSKQEIIDLIDFGIKIKQNPKQYQNTLSGKVLAMIFQKTSTRTRCSFEVGMHQLGGYAMFLDWKSTNFGVGQLKDEIKTLSRYVDVIMARVYNHNDLVEMAKYSSVPIINGLCNLYHPCQILADLMTIKEKKGVLEGLKLAYIGDGNNVCHSLLIGCSKIGLNMAVASPKNYEPKKEIIEYAKKYNSVKVMQNPKIAVENADIVYTDTWVSLGNEDEKKVRIKAFDKYQVNKNLMNIAKKNAIFMHCLPAHRGLEVSDEVIDSKDSVVFDQAENRMHIQKAVLLWSLLN